MAQAVAQSGTLPYRRLATCGRSPAHGLKTYSTAADCQSAIQQINNLRYDWTALPTKFCRRFRQFTIDLFQSITKPGPADGAQIHIAIPTLINPRMHR